MTVPNPAPKVGDKVVYDYPDATAGVWKRRTRRTSLVIDGPTADRVYRMYSGHEVGEWFASAERLRVVERASYTPVEASDA